MSFPRWIDIDGKRIATETGFQPNEFMLMQFTGRLDKNKKEVYKSDNLKCKDSYTGLEFTGTVEFQDCSFVIKSDCVTHYRWMDYEVEAVGNVWEDGEKGGE